VTPVWQGILYTSGSQPFLVDGTLLIRKNFAAHQKLGKS